MNDAPPAPGRPARAFLQPRPKKPFLKTREGALIALLAVLCAASSVYLVVHWRRANAAIERAEAERRRAEQQGLAAEATLERRLAEKRAALDTLFEGALADTHNGDDYLETPGYAKLLELLSTLKPEDVTARATEYLDYATARDHPDLYRGEFVRVRGIIGGLFAVKLERRVHELTDIWRGVVGNPDTNRREAEIEEAVVFDLLGDKPGIVPERTVVEVDGIFYRTVTYETKDRRRQTAPYLLARNLRVIEEQDAEAGSARTWTILVGVAAIAVYLALRAALKSTRKSGESPSRLRAMYKERLRGRREQHP